MKKIKRFKRLLSKGVTSYEGVLLELENGQRVFTSCVVGYSDANGKIRIETKNSVYENY